MRCWGTELEGVELGNAWALRSPETPHTNWVVGEHPGIPVESLRFLRHSAHPEGAQQVENLALKWFVHNPADPPGWGQAKPLSHGYTLSLLAEEGGFELCLRCLDQEMHVLLESPGDYVIWGPGIGHSWRAIKRSAVMTLRWQLVER